MSRIIAYIAAALAALMMVHVTIDVALSQFVAEPLPGTVDYVSYHYMVGLVFLPLPFVESTNEHIKVDLIHDLIPAAGRTVLDMLALVLSAVSCGLSLISALQILTKSRAFHARNAAPKTQTQ